MTKTHQLEHNAPIYVCVRLFLEKNSIEYFSMKFIPLHFTIFEFVNCAHYFNFDSLKIEEKNLTQHRTAHCARVINTVSFRFRIYKFRCVVRYFFFRFFFCVLSFLFTHNVYLTSVNLADCVRVSLL